MAKITGRSHGRRADRIMDVKWHPKSRDTIVFWIYTPGGAGPGMQIDVPINEALEVTAELLRTRSTVQAERAGARQKVLGVARS